MENGLTYISSDHIVGGIEFLPDAKSKFSIEGFHKWYGNYPVSVIDKVSIASKGGNFGTFGDECAQGLNYMNTVIKLIDAN